MPIRERDGQWHYRFWVNRREYTGPTGLEASERNEIAAMRKESEARRLVLEGKEAHLKIEVVRFSDAAEKFLTWAEAEHKDHPATAKRLRTSFASLTAFFGKKSLTAVTAGSIEDFKAWRATEHKVKDVTIRHDLHGLSKFFQYAEKHNWIRGNAVRKVEIPSDAEAVRIHVVTPAEEMLYFSKALDLSLRRKVMRRAFVGRRGKKERVKVPAHEITKTGDLMSLHDLGRLMVLHGCRPEELLKMKQSEVDLGTGVFRIVSGKSAAAKRTLKMEPEGKSIFARRLSKPGVFLFPGKRKGTHQKNVTTSHNDLTDKLGLRFVVYDFRHTYATRMARLGMPIPTLASILGHANLRSVMKYIHLAQAEIHAASSKYGAESAAWVAEEQGKIKAARKSVN